MTLDIITSELLGPVQHGFFARRGGASSGIFQGLNCGFGSSDQHEIVSINRARVADAMEVGHGALVGVQQIHSADVVHVTEAGQDTGKADALVTSTQGIALSVLTADCQPVLFADTKNGVIGAAHAGWKGAIAGVLEQTVNAMINIGAERTEITAAIGPTISQRAYEVGPEFVDQFIDENQDYARFFAKGRDDRSLFDLPAFGLYCLRNAGIKEAEWTRHCTYADPERFFSFRRSVHKQEADYGRLIAAIRL